jgi:GalNAc5-diNAcBac-PP-undecaprenol beta-1,3-glucosyltransferase
MSDLDATVLIPTHDHGPLVGLAIESALAQTVASLEVLVVGDGAPDVTRDIVADISARDPRVRYFDNPKGPRHGEVHRHAALSEARGRAVLYLSDDDLWRPHHVEVMLDLLANADIACAMCVKVRPDGRLTTRSNDLGVPRRRERLLAGGPGIPLSCAAHTLDAYRKLPFGWRTTPDEISTDKYMWQQFLNQPECRAAGSSRLTVISLGSPDRTEMSPLERLEEMETWWGRLRASSDTTLFNALEELAEAKAKNLELNAEIARLKSGLRPDGTPLKRNRKGQKRKKGKRGADQLPARTAPKAARYAARIDAKLPADRSRSERSVGSAGQRTPSSGSSQ